MKRWERYRERVVNAKSAAVFIYLLADMDQELIVNCCMKKNFGKCKLPTNEDCIACKMNWLNEEAEEKGEIFKWTNL